MQIDQKLIKDNIYRQVRRLIITGSLVPGQRLDIEEIAAQYNSSVTPVRDAMHMLSHEGLVTIKSRAGYYVTVISLKELRDLLDLRQILEVASAEQAAMRITAEELELLEHVHAGFTGEDLESVERYADENRHFHYLVAKASGNDELAETLGHLLDRLARFMVICGAETTMESIHARTIAALRTHNAQEARRASLEETTETRESVIAAVMEQQAATWHVGYQHHRSHAAVGDRRDNRQASRHAGRVTP